MLNILEYVGFLCLGLCVHVFLLDCVCGEYSECSDRVCVSTYMCVCYGQCVDVLTEFVCPHVCVCYGQCVDVLTEFVCPHVCVCVMASVLMF